LSFGYFEIYAKKDILKKETAIKVQRTDFMGVLAFFDPGVRQILGSISRCHNSFLILASLFY